MIAFTKMHGLGNDFVVIDRRHTPVALKNDWIRAIADRRYGIGCDQLVLIDPPSNGHADVALHFHNPDGGESAACGNGTRCVAAALMAEAGRTSLAIETDAGVLAAEIGSDGLVAVDMGPARTEWREIPLSEENDTLRLPVSVGPLSAPTGVSMGNPHCVFFVDDAETVALDRYGPDVENHPLFPERTNVEVASVVGPDRLRLRVWERGTGITLACGTGACATAVAAHRRGLTGRQLDLELDGGTLSVDWRDDGHVVLSGPVAVSFTGEIEP